MKTFVITSILVALFATGTTLKAQDTPKEYLGLPGDNLNLYAVMKLFQESKTLEEFERNLNDEKTNINNLDLNGDGLIDYIRVFDDVDGEVHNIVLQVAVSPKENQDVAVFTVQRFNNGQVQIQLTGDEELYGKNYIIEPIFDDASSPETPNPGYTGQTVTYIRTTPVEIAGWPLVRFIFLPSYTVWHSSWYWGYYPPYWHPWRPFSWNYYYGYHYYWNDDYFGHYRRWNYHRYSRWHDFYYTGRRSYSPDVYHRIQAGSYKTTYSHPEQRRDGEAMFAKMHPDQYRRVSSNSSGNNSVRGNDSRLKNNGKSNRPDANTTRRSATTVTNKSVKDPSAVRNTGANRRSSTTVTNKSAVNPPPGRTTETSRKSSTTMTDRSVSNPAAGKNAGTNRTTVKTKSQGVNSSSQRNIRKNKTETKIKKDNKTKESEKKAPGRRN